MTEILKFIIFQLWKVRININCYSKLQKILRANRSLKKPDSQFLYNYKAYWKKYGLRVNSVYFTLYSNICNHQDINFIPENIYYSIIEPSMNNKIMSKMYSNKNLYDILYNCCAYLPLTIIRRIDNVYYNIDYKRVNDIDVISVLSTFSKFIIKNSLDSGGGRSVEFFSKKDRDTFINQKGDILSLRYLNQHFIGDIIIQEYIQSHTYFSKFNSSSLNTVRVFTYRSVVDEEIKILHKIIRIGKEGSVVDNQAAGGISCGINNNGILNNFAIDKWGNKYFERGGYTFNDQIKVPLYQEILDMAISIASKNHYCRLLGIDLCVDINKNVRLIEVNNSNNEINFYQMNNGSLFGDFSSEIINWSIKSKKTFCLDYYI